MANIRYITSSGAGSRNFYSPAGALILWDGSTAPTGWSIETSLDGYFVMGGSAVDLTARGASTHTHTNPNTNYTGSHNNHTVTVSTSGAPSSTITAQNSASAQYTTSSHTHTATSTSNETK